MLPSSAREHHRLEHRGFRVLKAGRRRARILLAGFALLAPLVFGGCDEQLCGRSTENPLAGLAVGFLCLGYPDSDGERLDQPRAEFEVTPSEISSGGTVTLDASASRASLGLDLRAFQWDVDGRYTVSARGRGFDFEHQFRLGANGGTVQLFRRDPAIVRPPEEIIDNGTSETRIIALQVFDEEGSATALRRVTITGDVPQSGSGSLVASFSFTRTTVSRAERPARCFGLPRSGDLLLGPGRQRQLRDGAPERSQGFARLRHVGNPGRAPARGGCNGADSRQPREIFVAPLGPGRSRALAGAARRPAGESVSARLARVRFPTDLGPPRGAGQTRTFGPLMARGRLIAGRGGLGGLRRFRRSTWIARVQLVARPRTRSVRMRGVALARFPRGRGEACLRIRMSGRGCRAPAGRATVIGGTGPADGSGAMAASGSASRAARRASKAS